AAVGLVVGALYYARSTPVYQSAAQVLVVKKRPDVLPGFGAAQGGNIDDYVAGHVTLIRSPLIVRQAVEEWDLQSLGSLHMYSDPSVPILGSLNVGLANGTVTGSTNVLNLTYRGSDASDCRAVLNAVIDSYEKFLDETYQNVNEDTLKLITQKADE